MADAEAPGAGGDNLEDQTPAYSKEPKLSRGDARRLKERFRWGNKYYQNAFEKNAERCRDLYQGYHWPRKSVPKSRRQQYIVVNYLQHVVETIVSSIAFNEGEVLLKPKTPEAEMNQDRTERAVQWAYGEANAHRETKRALKDSVVYGFGLVAIGWLQETEDTPPIEGREAVEGEPPDPEDVLDAIERGGPPPAPIPKAKITTDRPFVKRLDPRQFRVSPEADWVLSDAPWCGFIEVRELDEVQADSRYKKGITRRLKGSTATTKPYLSEEYRKEDDETKLPADCKRVELWHYYEKRRRLHVVFAKEEEQPILVEPWYWKHERYPFRLIFAPGLEDEFYREMPPLLQWEHMQREINLARSQLATHRARFNTKIITPQGGFTASEEKKFESEEDGIQIRTQRPEAVNSAWVLPQPDLNPAVYSASTQAQQDLRDLSTLSQYEIGQAPTKRMTSSEVQAVQGAGGARQQAARQAYEELCAGAAEDILDLLQQFALRTRELPIYDPATDKIADWMPWDKDKIQGDYDFAVHVGSTQVKDKQGLTEEMGFVLQSAFPYVQMGLADGRELLKQFLMTIPDLKNVPAIVAPPPPQAPPGVPGAGPAMPGAGPPGPEVVPGGPGAAPPGGNGAAPPGGAPDLNALLAQFGGTGQ